MMLFDKSQLTLRKKAALHALPPVPSTGWKVPTDPPNLQAAKYLAIDTETKELEFEKGPGWGRGKGHIVGVSVAAEARDGTRGKWYFPVRHEVGAEDNLPPERVFSYLKPTFEDRSIAKVFANCLYDIGWLTTEDIWVQGPIHDVQFAEALIDEEALVNLDTLAHKYLGVGKTTDLMYEWIREAYPLTPKRETRSNIYRTPPSLVGHYAEDDAAHPLGIIKIQYEEMARQGLLKVYDLETRLVPLLILMRLEGVSVDVPAAEQLYDELQEETVDLYKRVHHEYGIRIDGTSAGRLKPLFDSVGIEIPRNAQGNLSVDKEWLAEMEHPVGQLIHDIREREKICGTFIQSYVLDKNVNGKIYPQFHPLKGERGGTKLGRFASSDPNFQNIPGRTKLGKRVRRLIIPDPGHDHWRKLDYSQIHYRILAHYAVGPGADDLRQSYITNKKMDYHKNVLERVAPLAGWDLTDETVYDKMRKPIKNVNFGLLYGQSQKALGHKSAAYFGDGGLAEEQVKEFFKAYFEGAPYVKPTMEAIGKEVQRYGFVTTLLGRRARFNLWESAAHDVRTRPLPYDTALQEYGTNIKRAFEYRGVNYKFQGSEPDIMKTGMVACFESGVYDYTGVPRLTVHDETDYSVQDDSPAMREAFAYIQHLMENNTVTQQLRVPMFADMEKGSNWGDVKEIE